MPSAPRLFPLVLAALVTLQGERPRVLLDEAHHNVHTLNGTYQPLAKLLTESGFRVRANTVLLTAAVLKDCDVLIVSNARGAGTSVPLAQRAAPAFSAAEIETIVTWVRGGGALLLVTDHWPIGPANQALGDRLGVSMSGGWTEDPAHTVAGPGHLVFSLENGLLADHAITRGRRDTERVRLVTSQLGQSLVGPAGSVSLLRLSPTALDKLPPDRRAASAAGKSQGLAFEVEGGRVVVLGEAGMLRLPPIGNPSEPQNDNRQFALNMMNWLSRRH